MSLEGVALEEFVGCFPPPGELSKSVNNEFLGMPKCIFDG